MVRFLTALTLLALAPFAAMGAEIGEDGLHKQPWLQTTFKDMAEDLGDAGDQGKRLAIIFEQRGCIYCTEMHENIFPRPEIHDYLMENYFVVRLNLHGDLDVTDFDGETLSEKQMARKWGILFTPTILFMPPEVPEGDTAPQAAVAMMPGAFGGQTTFDMLVWVNEERYLIEDGEDFQRYHARMIEERRTAGQGN